MIKAHNQTICYDVVLECIIIKKMRVLYKNLSHVENVEFLNIML